MRISKKISIGTKVSALGLILFTSFFSVSGGLRAYVATQNSQTELFEILEEKSFLHKSDKGRRLHQKRQQPVRPLLHDGEPEDITPYYLSSRFVEPAQWFSPPPLLRAPPTCA